MHRYPATAALSLCLFAFGCGQREAVKFNNALVNGDAKLSAARKGLLDAIVSNDAGGAEPATVRQHYSANVATLDEVKKQVAALSVPASKEAQDLAAQYQRFLEWHDAALKDQFAEVVRLVEDPKQEPLARRQRVRELVKQVEKGDLAAYGELHKLQMRFAREHDITLKKPER